MNTLEKTIIELENEKTKYFKFLFRLQKSGKTNMFGAVPFLREAFDLTRQSAEAILLEWMQNYEAIARRCGVDV